jgi:radical SAM protein with 4Fe4S-binding SPASM domain
MRNLDRLVDARDAAGSALHVRGVMVLMRVNLPELPALVQLLHDHGVHELLVQRLSSDLRQPELPARYIPIRSYVEQAELQPCDLARVAEVFEQARALATRLELTLHLPRPPDAPPASHSDGPRCRLPWEQLYLTAAGELLPCCMVATADRASFGNVFERGLLHTWHGETAQAFRQALNADLPPAVCRSCALYHGRF